MPSRNREKIYLPDGYYHIYNRGINKRVIFKDPDDYAVFLNLLKRYLDSQPSKDKQGREYESLYGRLDLLAFCLMPNHLHLLVYQRDSKAMTRLMRSVCTAYSSYFNKKYQRMGPLFQERFKASLVNSDKYLHHISRYIHLNPDNYVAWEFSSLPYYTKDKNAAWVKPGFILKMFNDKEEYLRFLADYKDHKSMLDEIKYELANLLIE